MRGLSFQLRSPKGFPLLEMFSCVEVKNYCWYVDDSQNDTWDHQMEQLLFDRFQYDGSCFYETIKQEHFVVFLKLQAFFPQDEFSTIESYDGFCKSNCQILLLIHDCCYVDIYIKDSSVLEKLYQHIVHNDCKNVHFIKDEDDTRTRMSVL